MDKILAAQRDPSRIRNICIVAHVDHGKTTLADSLVASNGLISQRMAGKLRYMDSRPDEQERGITMKSSAVTLTHGDNLINLIDSPGHVDFSSEVSTAVRLCDGAIVVVDVVEGVQPQTKVVLSQAYNESIRPVLVLNKVDRLITELKLTPLDAYLHLRSVLEQVNAVIGELFAAEVIRKGGDKKASEKQPQQEETFDWSTGLEDADDSELYFSPEYGNVVFASAYDGWAFSIDQFAQIFSEKLGFSKGVLAKTLWGDFYINTKTNKIMKGAQAKAKKPLFVQFVLNNIWAVYDAAVERKDKERLQKIIESLQIKVLPRDLRSNDPKQHINAIFTKWLPLAPCVLDMVVEKLPGPGQLTEDRVRNLMCAKLQRFEDLANETQELEKHFLNCSSTSSDKDHEDVPVIVFVSKMCPVPTSQLPKNRPKPLTAEEMAERRERAKQLQEERKQQAKNATAVEQSGVTMTAGQVAKIKLDAEEKKVKEEEEEEEKKKKDANETSFLAFARVFSGTLKPNMPIYVLGPKYDPKAALELKNNGDLFCDESVTIWNNKGGQQHIMRATVGELYLMLGRDLQELQEVPAGNVVGIGGLDNYILKSATLSSNIACPPFTEITQSAVPILRVALETTKSLDMPKLEQGLNLLNQADANVQVTLTDKGEYILVTAGEVHLERCLRDLKETYAGVEVVASAPIVPFRETIVPPPTTDMVNEELSESELKELDTNRIIEIQTPNKVCTISIRAIPLSTEVQQVIERNGDLIRVLINAGGIDNLASDTKAAVRTLQTELREHFPDELKGMIDRIWSFGPYQSGPNILFNNVETDTRRNLFCDRKSQNLSSGSAISSFNSSIINGFQLATQAGPLCEEPLRGVGLIVENFVIDAGAESDTGVYGPLSGQIVSTFKEGCRRAFQANPQRLMAAMYTCDIQVKAEVLGKLFASLGKRHGRVVSEDMIEGSSTFIVTAHLPVIESFQFSQEIRRQTSGLAMPQLVFSHWEVIDVDPFWVPKTEEELMHFGEKADSENLARKYMNDLRKRKGLAIDEKIVEFAEKQRTLTRMK